MLQVASTIFPVPPSVLDFTTSLGERFQEQVDEVLVELSQVPIGTVVTLDGERYEMINKQARNEENFPKWKGFMHKERLDGKIIWVKSSP